MKEARKESAKARANWDRIHERQTKPAGRARQAFKAYRRHHSAPTTDQIHQFAATIGARLGLPTPAVLAILRRDRQKAGLLRAGGRKPDIERCVLIREDLDRQGVRVGDRAPYGFWPSSTQRAPADSDGSPASKPPRSTTVASASALSAASSLRLPVTRLRRF